jgi:ankyrin repeat protein
VRKIIVILLLITLFFFGGCLPIHRAAYYGDFDKVKEIIERSPDQINVQDEQGFTPLHLASGKGHTEIVEFLLNHGADIESEIRVGETPLMLAAWYAKDGKYETIKALLEHGAMVDHKGLLGQTALHHATIYSGEKAINLLISYGADVNARGEYQITPLHKAAMHNKIEAAKVLVENGADIFAKTSFDFRNATEIENLRIVPIKNYMNKTAKEIALAARPGDKYKELAQYLQTKEEEKEKGDK